ncbi:hypothetical protein FOT62_24375 [Serratia marcescens]|uniref:Uncharacterized protein n=1 Tax=Serratia marcescens TaxID=615 RepID=A0A5C7BM33_SERMA|nr:MULTISPECIES: hypothetical protein [Serratia]TXE24850.1 hypothetical protein FOT62_24375 [Serratia marcescens]TXE53356.1 hypothetical protein FOT56_26810 [Serratia marcescens]
MTETSMPWLDGSSIGTLFTNADWPPVGFEPLTLDCRDFRLTSKGATGPTGAAFDRLLNGEAIQCGDITADRVPNALNQLRRQIDVEPANRQSTDPAAGHYGAMSAQITHTITMN